MENKTIRAAAIIQGPLQSIGRSGGAINKTVNFDCREVIKKNALSFLDQGFCHVFVVLTDYEPKIEMLESLTNNNNISIHHISSAKINDWYFTNKLTRRNSNKYSQYNSTYLGILLALRKKCKYIFKCRTDQLFNSNIIYRSMLDNKLMMDEGKVLKAYSDDVRPFFMEDFYFAVNIDIAILWFRELAKKRERSFSAHEDMFRALALIRFNENLNKHNQLEEFNIEIWLKSFSAAIKNMNIYYLWIYFESHLFENLPAELIQKLEWRGSSKPAKSLSTYSWDSLSLNNDAIPSSLGTSRLLLLDFPSILFYTGYIGPYFTRFLDYIFSIWLRIFILFHRTDVFHRRK